MPNFTVYERQILLVAYEVEADDAETATIMVSTMNTNEYDYIVDSDCSIENVENSADNINIACVEIEGTI